jgi:hypothetical protein
LFTSKREEGTIHSMVINSTNISSLFYGLNPGQQKTLAIAPKCTSVLSMIGSLYVICNVLSRENSPHRCGQNGSSYTNLLLGLSVADLIASIGIFLSTWPIPKDNIYSDYIWGDDWGNQTTCNAQGKNIFLVFFARLR